MKRLGVTVNAIAPRANTRRTEGLREWTPEEAKRRDPDWLASSESAAVSGRVFEAWGFGIGVAEGWQHGPHGKATLDPAELEPRVREMLAAARPNAGIDRDRWMDP